MSPIPVEAIINAIQHVNAPIVIYREDTILLGIMLGEALSQFGVKIDPAAAWLSLVDAYAVYCGVKKQAAKHQPEKVRKDTITVSYIETPLEEVYTQEHLRELAD